MVRSRCRGQSAMPAAPARQGKRGATDERRSCPGGRMRVVDPLDSSKPFKKLSSRRWVFLPSGVLESKLLSVDERTKLLLPFLVLLARFNPLSSCTWPRCTPHVVVPCVLAKQAKGSSCPGPSCPDHATHSTPFSLSEWRGCGSQPHATSKPSSFPSPPCLRACDHRTSSPPALPPSLHRLSRTPTPCRSFPHCRPPPPSFFFASPSLPREGNSRERPSNLSVSPATHSGVLLDTIASCHCCESPSFHF